MKIGEALDKLKEQSIYYPNKELIIEYTAYESTQCIVIGDLNPNEHISVNFDNGFIIVSTETSVVFVCKAKSFISLRY